MRVGGSENKIDILSGERLCLRPRARAAGADSFGIMAAATAIVYLKCAAWFTQSSMVSLFGVGRIRIAHRFAPRVGS